MREWKPGDVAMVKCDDAACVPKHPAILGSTGSWWLLDLGQYSTMVEPQRPLVVIDPEDREQVERLRDAIYQSSWDAGNAIDDTPALQAALRDFANPKPPRPEEPTGLGAVVEDANGTRWVRTDRREPEHRDYRWTAGNGYLMWHEIDVVRVLSEGVVS